MIFGLYMKNEWKISEIIDLEIYYKKTPLDLFSISEIAQRLNRTEAAVALKASKMGFSMPRGKRLASNATRTMRSVRQKAVFEREPWRQKQMVDKAKKLPNGFLGKNHSPEYCTAVSERFKKWHLKNPHPRGMLGKVHTQEAKDRISAANVGKKIPPERVLRMVKTKEEKGILHRKRLQASWKAGWREIGGRKIYARSRWEANYGRYLEFQKVQGLISEWEHEPETFWFDKIKRGVCSYLPDFKVFHKDGSSEFHEVKGWMDGRSKTKLKRMKKYHPSIRVVLVDSKRINALNKTVGRLIPSWEG